jgi:serine-type D-Ala-D-Ala carboxypeptidase/endopeptidase
LLVYIWLSLRLIQLKNKMRPIVGLMVCAFVALPSHAQQLSFTSAPSAIADIVLGDERGSVSVGVLRSGLTTFHFLENALDDNGKQTQSANRELAVENQPIYEIASITKIFTGLLLAQAVERGDLALSDNLGKLLKSVVNIDSPEVAKVTLEQLITHRSCMPRSPIEVKEGTMPNGGPYAGFTHQTLWLELKTLKIQAKADCPYAYSNLGIGLVGEVLAIRYGKPWQQLVKENITDLLGMKDTVQFLADKAARVAPVVRHFENTGAWEFDALAGAGALRSTPADMLTFANALMAGRNGPLGGAVERLLTPLAKLPTGEIGYAIFMSGPPEKRTYWHSGATQYRSHLTFTSDTKEAVVIMASTPYGAPSKAEVRLLASRYPIAVSPSIVDATTLSAYAGDYKLEDGLEIKVVAHRGQLYRRSLNGAFRVIEPNGPDTFIDKDYMLQYTFIREQGKVTGAKVLHGSATRSAVRAQEVDLKDAFVADEKKADYVGVYERKRNFKRDLYFDIRFVDGQLTARSSSWPRFNVYPMSDKPDRFYYEATKAELQFERDDVGRVTGVTLFENGRLKMEKTAN